jgi:hypothetical protein
MWSVEEAVELAREYVGGLGDRWAHLAAVGRTAQLLARQSHLVSEDVVMAAWLHDVGYSPVLAATGFHSLDGARFLESVDVPGRIVALVGHHTGAWYEAEERGLVGEWHDLPSPALHDLDVLTMIDLGIGPAGKAQRDIDRIADILARYGQEDPVHRAVSRSRKPLLTSSARSKRLLGLPDDWPVVPSERVANTESHGGMQL